MAGDLHFEILPKRQRLLFNVFADCKWLKSFYLAGGTALALQIAHRRSIDFDFFAEKEFDVRVVRKKLTKIGEYRVQSESESIIDGRLNSVRVSLRGSRKDFIDLYFLLQEFSLEAMIRFYKKKYGENEENVYCVLKGLVYFNNAEEKPMPSMLERVAWREMKKCIVAAHKNYIKSLRKIS